MKLDPEKCPIGTVGYLPPGGADDFSNPDDFAWFKEPSVALGADRKWHSINPDPRDNTFAGGDERNTEISVFADWKSAVRYALDRERENAKAFIEDARKEIAEFEKTIEQANIVEQWLSAAT